MKYESFTIRNYRAIKGPLTINLHEAGLVPLIGLNECGKTTILQAIFAFDHVNDEEYEGRHIKDVINLYETTTSTPEISSAIRGSATKWNTVIDAFFSSENKKLDQAIAKLSSAPPGTAAAASSTSAMIDECQNSKNILARLKEDLNNLVKSCRGVIRITRNLASLKYLLPDLVSDSPEQVDRFAHRVLSAMPFILYNDDFQDRPPSQVTIVEDESEESPWQEIFNKLFKETNIAYSIIGTAQEEDSRRRESIVSDVQAKLNKTLSKAWKSFHLDRNKKVKIRLGLTPFVEGEARLSISIVENIGDQERFFQVVDRSKGFLWFYNFVMKTEFNPKNVEWRSETIYLLDEPGSYLHSAAQTKLCEKLRRISQNNGKVIYCTHSPHLLNPDFIPINDIRIVQKDNKKRITVSTVPQYKTSEEKTSALQPVFESLQISGRQYLDGDRKIVAVEGIYDKYALSVFVDIGEDYNILPGTGANSIVKNIQFMNAFGSDYVAVWDNDQEGQKEYRRAVEFYGKRESGRFALLPLAGERKRRMESMFTQDDLSFLRVKLELPGDSTYESIFVTLFYKSENVKVVCRDGMSSECKNLFENLREEIVARFKSLVHVNGVTHK